MKHGDIDFSKEKYEDLKDVTIETLNIEGMEIPRISGEITSKDRKKNLGILFGIGRDNYMVKPGIYALGNPKDTSPVIVSCNYKYTFDILRKDLEGLDCWVLILNTFGVNVWCAAGKGTFGTDELIRRIKNSNLEKVVRHKVLILPQLGAPGINVHDVRKLCGFRCLFGPVDSKDIKEYINNKYKATEEMRSVKFQMKDRIKLTPLQFIQNIKYYFIASILLVLVNLIKYKDFGASLNQSIYESIPFIIGIFSAAVLFPVLLPYLPFRAFAFKGTVLSLLTLIPILLFRNVFHISGGYIRLIPYSILFISMMVNICINFTGSTTYTSFSGVIKETVWTIPVTLVLSIISLITMCFV